MGMHFTLLSKYVKIRIISEANLSLDFETKRKRSRSDNIHGASSGVKVVLIHIHGGGFVASTSRGHQHYVRKWAKMIPDCVIMSVDYRLAPEFPYPAALDDVWQGYYWIINYSWQLLGEFRVLTE